MTFIEAEIFCSNWGGKLVSIGSEAEAKVVNSMVASDRQYWIGFNDVLDSGNWTWADDSYDNWE